MKRPPRVALLLCSDRAARGERADQTATRLREVLAGRGFSLDTTRVVPDEQPVIEAALRELVRGHALVLTSGGTGIGPRDVTVEATRAVLEREIPGMGEAMRAVGLTTLPTAMLSRATAGTLGQSLIVNLPGSPRGASECLDAVAATFPHALELLAGEVRDCTPPEDPA